MATCLATSSPCKPLDPQIASILIGFGVTRVVDRLGLRTLPLLPRRQPRLDVTRLSEPERMRRAIEALGPTFIKFGQILASRPDLLSPAWTEELQKLHSQVPPVPWERIRDQLEQDLGGPVTEVFAEFNIAPLASTSIAHRCKACFRYRPTTLQTPQRIKDGT